MEYHHRVLPFIKQMLKNWGEGSIHILNQCRAMIYSWPARNWEQTKCPSVREYIPKISNICAMDYYLPDKMGDIISY